MKLGERTCFKGILALGLVVLVCTICAFRARENSFLPTEALTPSVRRFLRYDVLESKERHFYGRSYGNKGYTGPDKYEQIGKAQEHGMLGKHWWNKFDGEHPTGSRMTDRQMNRGHRGGASLEQEGRRYEHNGDDYDMHESSRSHHRSHHRSHSRRERESDHRPREHRERSFRDSKRDHHRSRDRETKGMRHDSAGNRHHRHRSERNSEHHHSRKSHDSRPLELSHDLPEPVQKKRITTFSNEFAESFVQQAQSCDCSTCPPGYSPKDTAETYVNSVQTMPQAPIAQPQGQVQNEYQVNSQAYTEPQSVQQIGPNIQQQQPVIPQQQPVIAQQQPVIPQQQVMTPPVPAEQSVQQVGPNVVPVQQTPMASPQAASPFAQSQMGAEQAGPNIAVPQVSPNPPVEQSVQEPAPPAEPHVLYREPGRPLSQVNGAISPEQRARQVQQAGETQVQQVPTTNGDSLASSQVEEPGFNADIHLKRRRELQEMMKHGYAVPSFPFPETVVSGYAQPVSPTPIPPASVSPPLPARPTPPLPARPAQIAQPVPETLVSGACPVCCGKAESSYLDKPEAAVGSSNGWHEKWKPEHGYRFHEP